MKKMKVEPL